MSDVGWVGMTGWVLPARALGGRGDEQTGGRGGLARDFSWFESDAHPPYRERGEWRTVTWRVMMPFDDQTCNTIVGGWKACGRRRRRVAAAAAGWPHSVTEVRSCVTLIPGAREVGHSVTRDARWGQPVSRGYSGSPGGAPAAALCPRRAAAAGAAD